MPKKSIVTQLAVVAPMPSAKLLVSIPEAAQALSLGQTQVWKMVASGELRSVRIGRARRVLFSALQEYVLALAGG